SSQCNRRHPTSTLFPYTTLFRSKLDAHAARKSVGTVITIDQSTFTLRLFKHQKVVKTYKVAVGQPAYPTPNGRFAIQSKQIDPRSEEHTSELQSQSNLVCRLLLE